MKFCPGYGSQFWVIRHTYLPKILVSSPPPRDKCSFAQVGTLLRRIWAHQKHNTSIQSVCYIMIDVLQLCIIAYWLRYGTNFLIWSAKRQSVHNRTDRCMDRKTHWHNTQRNNSVKFHLILFHLCRYAKKLLLTEISIHTANICCRMNLIALSPYALNVRTNISSYGPRTRLIKACLKFY